MVSFMWPVHARRGDFNFLILAPDNWFVLPAGGGHLLCNGLSLGPCSTHLDVSALFTQADNCGLYYKQLQRTQFLF